MPITIRKIELFCSLLFFSPTSLQRAKNACFSLIFPEKSAFRNGFELRRSDVKKYFFFNIFRRRSVESSSDNFRFFPTNTVSCDIYQKTRNQFDSNVAWVRLPPSAPKAAPCGVLFSVFIASFARWDSNSPCPALCAPPGCKNPVGCCKGAGTPIICTISDVESKDFTADALGGFSGATTPSSVGESKKDYIVKRSSGIMKVRSANCTNKIPGGL